MRVLQAILLHSLWLTVAAAAAGAACRLEQASIGFDGSAANDLSQSPSVNGDGRFVAFISLASNLVPGDTNRTADIFVRDRQSGVTERVSVDSAGQEARDPSGVGSPMGTISADGRFVAFESDAANLVGDDRNGVTDIFVRDRTAGTTERVSVDDTGQEANDRSARPAVSADGRFIAFESIASNLAANDTTECEIVVGRFVIRRNCSDIFVHDRATGSTERVSGDPQGNDSGGSSGRAAISTDGHFVAFDSDSQTLVEGDESGYRDVYLRDRLTGVTERVSVGSAGELGNGDSFRASLSGDGRYVAFESYANTLVPGDTSDTQTLKAFIRDRLTGTTERLQRGGSPVFSATGRYLAFASGDVFVRDRVTGATRPASIDESGNPLVHPSRAPATSP